MNYRQVMAIQNANKKRILKVCPEADESSGIYILTREENGFRFCYIGQANKLLTRLASHLSGYSQHIDRSLKTHKFYSEDNITGWKVEAYNVMAMELDSIEQQEIKIYANNGYQMLNKTSGSQGKGKAQIAEYKPAKGYHDGLKQGYKNAQRDVAKWFRVSLEFDIKGKSNKNKEKAKERFEEFKKVGE